MPLSIIETKLENGFLLRLLRQEQNAGHRQTEFNESLKSWSEAFRKNGSAKLFELASVSLYAPAKASLIGFVDKIFAGEQSAAQASHFEHCLLGLLMDSLMQVQGFIQLRFFDDTADLDFIVIHPSLRGQGFAQLLLNEAQAIVAHSGVKRLLLEVGHGNIAAQRLYEKLGFIQISMRRKYYPSGEDAVVMEKVF